MEIVRLGKQGEVQLPPAILQELGLSAEASLSVEATQGGEIILRPLDGPFDHLIEIYDEARLREFAEADKITPDEAEQVARLLRQG